MTPNAPAVPRLTYLRIKNYRALRDVEFRDLTPLTVLIGPNGSGKSTVLDALDFLAEAVRGNLVGAWEKRDRFEGMRTRGSEGPVSFELEILPTSGGKKVKYQLAISEVDSLVFVKEEYVWIESAPDKYDLLFQSHYYADEGYNRGSAGLGSYAVDDLQAREKYYERHQKLLVSPEFSTGKVAVKLLSLVSNQAQEVAGSIVALLESYRRIHLTDDHLVGFSTKGPREKLSPNGDNLPNVLYYLHTKHPEVLAKITAQLRRWVPNLTDIVPEITSDKRLLLKFKDAAFEELISAEYMSEGTMRLVAWLALLNEAAADGILGLVEPENGLHPRLLRRLADELTKATRTRQLLVITHSPPMLDALDPEQVWIVHRDAAGYSQVTRTDDVQGIRIMVEEGSPLGSLWQSNFFDIDDPLAGLTPVPKPDAH